MKQPMVPIALVLLLAAGCATAPPQTSHNIAPPDVLRQVDARHGAVASANALASEAGIEMLRAGGNAVDAAVATSLALGVVEPQMSGLGGSGAMLIWMQAEAQPYYLDFYAAQNAASFRGRTGGDPAEDLRIVGIPGQAAGLIEAHQRFGALPFAQVAAPAIRLAEDGFPVGQVLSQFILASEAKLSRHPAARAQMMPADAALEPGTIYRNPELARTLREIAAQGRRGFDDGTAGQELVRVLNAGGHPASPNDMRSYQPQWKRPLCTVVNGRILLSAPPPQTGAQLLQTLKLLEPLDLPALGLPHTSPAAFDALVSALRVAQADNRGTNDDPRWRRVAAAGRLADVFIERRRGLVGRGAAPDSIATADASSFDDVAPHAACAPLRPWPADAPRIDERVGAPRNDEGEGAPRVDESDDALRELEAGRGGLLNAREEDGGSAVGETTHLSVVDRQGNAVSLSQTNSTVFGSGAWAAGFFLNDSGYLFRSDSSTLGSAQWRTRTSTIAPTIVLEDGRVRVVTGAPGAGRIPTEVAQTLIYILSYGMSPLDALRMPRVFPAPSSTRVQLEHGFPPDLLARIRDMGYRPPRSQAVTPAST
jgi:gamma-glutamyltranspeptidase / glutathione hydrolase